MLGWTVIFITVGCFSFDKTDRAPVTFDNRTNTVLCYYPASEAAATARCIAPIKPMDKTEYSQGCGLGAGVEENLLTVVITQGEGGTTLYNKTATCRTWKGQVLVIEQRHATMIVSAGPP